LKKLDYYLQQVRIKKAAYFVRDGDDILDIGSGDGALFRWVSKEKIQFSGIGMDPELPVEILSPNYRILKERFPSESIKNRLFTVITALAVLEHIPMEELKSFIRDCRNQLKTGGLIVITVPSKWVDPILNLLIKMRVIDGMEVEQHHGYDTNLTIPLFEENGFELVRHRRFQFGLNNLFVFRKVAKNGAS
jgi:2-polyprenyl-3-methyl-5-hydroxy-6-metoxy-1,4-benzoquinol methylase